MVDELTICMQEYMEEIREKGGRRYEMMIILMQLYIK